MKISKWIGETTDYEKKEKVEERRPKSWLKSVSAFANGTGGAIIFGISDDDKPIGLNDAQHDAEIISEAIKTHMDPMPKIRLVIETDSGKEFIALTVLPGDETPYYYVGDGVRTAFIRIGNESIPASAADLRRLVLRGSGRTYDSLPTSYKYKDFSFTRLRSVYRKRTGQEIEDSDFVSFCLMDDNGILTNAGALLADDSPIRHSRLFCTRWYGTDKASGIVEALDDKEYTGSLVELLQNGEEFIKNNTKKRWKKTPDGRIEMPDIPERAALECLVNALIHRDYMETGSEVHIDIFDDRMEIYSPGGMLSGTPVQDLNTDYVPSKRRNPIIADIFSRMNYMERRGSGFKKIKADYRDAVNYLPELEPQFYSDNSSFWVRLYNLNYHVVIEETEQSSLECRKATFEDGKATLEDEKATFKDGKATLEDGKTTFEDEKAMLKAYVSEQEFHQSTKDKIIKIYETVGESNPFARKDIMEIVGGSSYAAGELIKKMMTVDLIRPAPETGRGNYCFRKLD